MLPLNRRPVLAALTWAGLLGSVVALAAPAAAQEDFTPLDMLMLRSVSGAYPSPDGDRIAFTRSVPRGPEDGPGYGYVSLYMLTGDGERALVDDKRVLGGVAWTPDGASLTYLSGGGEGAGNQLFALSPDGGAPRQLFRTPDEGILTYRWSPDGSAVAFTSTAPTPDRRARAREAGFPQRIYDEDWNPIGLFVWSKETGEIRKVELPGSVYALEWSPDGTRLLTAIAPRNLIDDSFMLKRIHLVDVASGTVVKLVDNPGKLAQIGWSPDGTAIAYVSAVDPQDPHAGMLFSADASSGEVTALTPGFEGMVRSFEWTEPDRIRLVISRGAESRVSDLDVRDRTFSDLPAADFAFESIRTVGDLVVATGSSPRFPTELHQLDGRAWTRRTDSNPSLAGVELSRQEIYSFAASDGVEVDGILVYPSGFREGTRYPLVIAVHGGPESHNNNGWLADYPWLINYGAWGQLLSRKGFFVWYPNYRSSTGRGVAYAKADHGDLAGREFDDQVDAIDHFVERGWVDGDRVGIGGASYGGFAAAWGATKHTDRYAAAVSMVPIIDAGTMWLSTDIPVEYYFAHYQEKGPFEQWDYLAERSPLHYATQSRTPTLVGGGTVDPRVHPSQPLMLYRAIEQATDTPVRYVQYPGEKHGNTTNVYRYDFLVRTLRWFEYYLRPGDHRSDPLPPMDVDYGGWLGGR
jgi:dipeptidyl aminopeptidase/acylaminoacyl peptidase